MARIHPVLLSGGAGTRLWPLSRAAYPKQFLSLLGDRSLLQTTALRVSDPDLFEAPMVVANAEHRFIVAEQLRQIGIQPSAILLEPVGRNSGPAALAAAVHLLASDPEAILLLLAADHAMTRPDAFVEAIRAALSAARKGRIVTFGISPNRPETAYGYILAGEDADTAVRPVERFVEKPDAPTARRYLEDGRYLWNSGNFLAAAGTLVAEATRYAPDMLEGVRTALASSRIDLDFLRLDAAAYEAISGRSLDKAIMEHTAAASVVACDPGWSDIGSFDDLADALGRDGDGNTAAGPAHHMDSTATVAISTGPRVATLGLRNTIVVATDDAVLVADSGRVQEVGAVVERLRELGVGNADEHAEMHRPWGSYRNLDVGDGFLVKEIWIKPGGRLSLQTHTHRSEHWVVIEGHARVTLGQSADSLKVVELAPHHSIDIPRGWVHRLENVTDAPLGIVEVQSGPILTEEDIERLDDVYGRT